MPALALVPYLRPYFSNVCYAGEAGGVEERLAEAEGLPFFGTRTIKFDRRHLMRNTAIPRVLSAALREVQGWLSRIGCGVVFSKGGYCALPTVLAAHRLHVPIVCHESDLTIGLANRLTLLYTRHLITSFDVTPRGVYMGNPIRDAVFEGRAERVAVPNPHAPTLLVMGGSMGAVALNRYAAALAERMPQWNVLNLYGKSPVDCASPNYVGVPFADHIADYFARADVVLCRAGANTLFELAALGKPTVTVPLPKGASRGDQVANAAWFAAKCGFDALDQATVNVEVLADAVHTASSRTCQTPAFDSPNARIARYIYDVYRGEMG